MSDGWVVLQLLTDVGVEVLDTISVNSLIELRRSPSTGGPAGVAFFASAFLSFAVIAMSSSLAALSCAFGSEMSSSHGRWRWLPLSFAAAARGVWR